MKPLHSSEHYEERYGGQLLAPKLQMGLNEYKATMARLALEDAKSTHLSQAETLQEMLGAMSLGTVYWGEDVLVSEALSVRDRRIVETMVETAQATC